MVGHEKCTNDLNSVKEKTAPLSAAPNSTDSEASLLYSARTSSGTPSIHRSARSKELNLAKHLLPPHRSYPPIIVRGRSIGSNLSTIESSNNSGSGTQSDFSADNVFSEGDNISEVSLLVCGNNSRSSIDLDPNFKPFCITKPVASVLPNINKSKTNSNVGDELNQHERDEAGAWNYSIFDPGTSGQHTKKYVKSPKPIRYWYIPNDENSTNTLPKTNKPTCGQLPSKFFIAPNFSDDIPPPPLPRNPSTEIGRSNPKETTSAAIRRATSHLTKSPNEYPKKPTIDIHDDLRYGIDTSLGSSLTSPNLRLRHSVLEPSSREGISELRLHQLNLLGVGLSSGLHAIASLKSPPFNVENKIYDRHAQPQPPPRPPPLQHQQNISSFGPQNTLYKPPAELPRDVETRRSSGNDAEEPIHIVCSSAETKHSNRSHATKSDSSGNARVPDELHSHLQTCRCTCNHLGYGNYQVCFILQTYVHIFLFIVVNHFNSLIDIF